MGKVRLLLEAAFENFFEISESSQVRLARKWYNRRRKSGENHDEEESRKDALPELAGTVQGQASHKGLDRHAPRRQLDKLSANTPLASGLSNARLRIDS